MVVRLTYSELLIEAPVTTTAAIDAIRRSIVAEVYSRICAVGRGFLANVRTLLSRSRVKPRLTQLSGNGYATCATPEGPTTRKLETDVCKTLQMASCASCVAPGYPEVYSPGRQTAGLVIAVLVFALSVIGFALYWCRRHERLFVARSSWTVYLAGM